MATFYNQATLSYNGTVASSNITAGEILEVLSASKRAVSDSYSADSGNVFIISIVNTGSSCYNGLTVTDDLGRKASVVFNLYVLATNSLLMIFFSALV